MSTTTNWQDFYGSFMILKKTSPSYRLGQHFINMFITDESTDEVLDGLWNKTGDEAFIQCFEVIGKYQWDVNELPLANRR